MSAPVLQGPIVQGWCPGALRPMMSGDGLVVRIRPRSGRLTQEQAAGIAELSQAHGNGLLDLSSRANLQLRGIGEGAHPALIEDLDALGLVDGSTEAEAMRNIMVQPFWAEGDGTMDLADKLASALRDAPALPGKFGYALDTGARPVLRAAPADVRIERDADGGLIVAAEGMETGARSTGATVTRTVLDLVGWFAASGGMRDGRGRMAAHIARGANAPAAFREVPRLPAQDAPARPGLVPQGAMVGFEFGQLSATTLAALARLGPLRLTPWRMLLIEGLGAMPDLPGLITDPADPLLSVIACTGAPGCLQALGPTRDLARRLAPVAPGLHVSGCAKGCAHPSPAAVTLVATSQGYDLIRGGRASDPPDTAGLSADDLMSLFDAP